VINDEVYFNLLERLQSRESETMDIDQRA